MELELFHIENAAESVLRDLRRTSFNNDGFSDSEVSAIARAIAAAIAEYDRQKKEES